MTQPKSTIFDIVKSLEEAIKKSRNGPLRKSDEETRTEIDSLVEKYYNPELSVEEEEKILSYEQERILSFNEKVRSFKSNLKKSAPEITKLTENPYFPSGMRKLFYVLGLASYDSYQSIARKIKKDIALHIEACDSKIQEFSRGINNASEEIDKYKSVCSAYANKIERTKKEDKSTEIQRLGFRLIHYEMGINFNQKKVKRYQEYTQDLKLSKAKLEATGYDALFYARIRDIFKDVVGNEILSKTLRI